jgi:hypothetical protein
MRVLKGQIKIDSAVKLEKGVKVSEAKKYMLQALQAEVEKATVKNVMWEVINEED